MPDELAPGDGPGPGRLVDVDLLRARAAPAGPPHGRAWCLLHVGELPVGRAVLTLDRDGHIEADGLRQALAGRGLARAVHGALVRIAVAELQRGGRSSLPDAIRAALRRGDAMTNTPSVTIAICTRDRAGQLRRALEALSGIRDTVTDVLVVENAPADPQESQALRRDFPWVRFVIEPAPGLDVARNRALAEARSDVVAFTDDDTVVTARFVPALRRLFDSAPEVAVCCGLIEPLHPGTDGSAVIESYGGLGRGYARRWGLAPVPQPLSLMSELGITSGYGGGAAMAVRRETALALGGFDPALDAGTSSAAGGDLEFLFRALKAGFALCYEPAAVVRHEHRSTRDAALEQVEHWGTGLGAYLARTARAYPEERWATRSLMAWLLLAHYGRRAAWSLVDRRFARDMLVRDVRGLLRGAERYREAARNAPAPVAPRAPAVSHVTTHHVIVDVRQPIPSLALASGASAQVVVRVDHRSLGTLSLTAVRGHVGSARLADAVASAFGDRLLGAGPDQARAAVLDAITGA